MTLEQIDRALQTGIAFFALLYMTRVTFKTLQNKHSDRRRIFLLLSAIAVNMFIFIPPMLLLFFTITLFPDPESWFELLLPFVIFYIIFFATYTVANRLFLQ
jgi:hypothetical protein